MKGVDLPQSSTLARTDLRSHIIFTEERTLLGLTPKPDSAREIQFKSPLSTKTLNSLDFIGRVLEAVQERSFFALVDLCLLSGEAHGWLSLRASEVASEKPLKSARAKLAKDILELANNSSLLNEPFSSRRLREGLGELVDHDRLEGLLSPDHDIELADLLLTLYCLANSKTWKDVFTNSIRHALQRSFLIDEIPTTSTEFAQVVLAGLGQTESPPEESAALSAILSRLPGGDNLLITPTVDVIAQSQRYAEGFLSTLLSKRSELSSLLVDLCRTAIYLNCDSLRDDVKGSQEYRLAHTHSQFISSKPPAEDALRSRVEILLRDLLAPEDLSSLMTAPIPKIIEDLTTVNSLVATHEGVSVVISTLLGELSRYLTEESSDLSMLNSGERSQTNWAIALTTTPATKPSETDPAKTEDNTEREQTSKLELRNRPPIDSPPGLLVRLEDLVSSYKAQRQFTSELTHWAQRLERSTISHLPADDFLPRLVTLARTISDIRGSGSVSEAVKRSYHVDHTTARSCLVSMLCSSNPSNERLDRPHYRVRGFQVGDYRGPNKIVFQSGNGLSRGAIDIAFEILSTDTDNCELAAALAESFKVLVFDTSRDLGEVIDLSENPTERFITIAWNIHREDPLDSENCAENFSRTLLKMYDEIEDSNKTISSFLTEPENLARALILSAPRSGVRSGFVQPTDRVKFVKIFESIRRTILQNHSTPQSMLHRISSDLISQGVPDKLETLIREISSGEFFQENDGGRYLLEFLKERGLNRRTSRHRASLPTITNDKLPSIRTLSGLQLQLSRIASSKGPEVTQLATEITSQVNDRAVCAALAGQPAQLVTEAILSHHMEGTLLPNEVVECLKTLAIHTRSGIGSYRKLRGQTEQGVPVYHDPGTAESSNNGEADALSVVMARYLKGAREGQRSAQLAEIIDAGLTKSRDLSTKLPATYIVPFDAILALFSIYQDTPEKEDDLALAALKLAASNTNYLRELKFIFDGSATNPKISKLLAQLTPLSESAERTADRFLAGIFAIRSNLSYDPKLRELASDLTHWWLREGVLTETSLPTIEKDLQMIRSLSDSEMTELLSERFKAIDRENLKWEFDWRER